MNILWLLKSASLLITEYDTGCRVSYAEDPTDRSVTIMYSGDKWDEEVVVDMDTNAEVATDGVISVVARNGDCLRLVTYKRYNFPPTCRRET